MKDLIGPDYDETPLRRCRVNDGLNAVFQPIGHVAARYKEPLTTGCAKCQLWKVRERADIG